MQGWSDDLEGLRHEAGLHIGRCLTLAPGDARCLAIAGHVRAILHHQPREAMELHEQALLLNPNLDIAIGLAAMTSTYLGDITSAVGHFNRYISMSPSPLLAFYYDAGLTLLEILRRDNSAAIRYGRRATELNPYHVDGLIHYLCALGHSGLSSDARLVLQPLLAVDPGFSIQTVINHSCLSRPADLSHYTAGLRLAGAA